MSKSVEKRIFYYVTRVHIHNYFRPRTRASIFSIVLELIIRKEVGLKQKINQNLQSWDIATLIDGTLVYLLSTSVTVMYERGL